MRELLYLHISKMQVLILFFYSLNYKIWKIGITKKKMETVLSQKLYIIRGYQIINFATALSIEGISRLNSSVQFPRDYLYLSHLKIAKLIFKFLWYGTISAKNIFAQHTKTSAMILYWKLSYATPLSFNYLNETFFSTVFCPPPVTPLFYRRQLGTVLLTATVTRFYEPNYITFHDRLISY